MKSLITRALLSLSLLSALPSMALAHDVYVNGYTKANGTYVEPYHRTSPDNTVNNNYGTQGNVNPYTQQIGTTPRNPYQPAGEYNQGNNSAPRPINVYGN